MISFFKHSTLFLALKHNIKISIINFSLLAQNRVEIRQLKLEATGSIGLRQKTCI